MKNRIKSYAKFSKLIVCTLTAFLLSIAQQTLLLKAAAVNSRKLPTDSGETIMFAEDSGSMADAWRFGNAILSDGLHRLELNYRHPEVTLSGTALHPDNMKTFTLNFRWKFIHKDQKMLLVGWGKPKEWDFFSECPVHLSLNHEGRARVTSGTQVLGEMQLVVPNDSIFELTVIQKPNRIILNSLDSQSEFLLPAGTEARPGYLTFRAGDTAAKSKKWKIQFHHVEISPAGKRMPITEEERNREIQSWAKDRINANRDILNRFRTHIEDETVAGRWGYTTDVTVSPGLVQQGEKVFLQFKVDGPVPSLCKAFVVPDFLRATAAPAEPVQLNWESNRDGGYRAVVELTPQTPGNWQVVWQVGQETLHRIFAVIAPGYLVCRMLVTTHKGPWIPGHEPEVYDLIHKYGLTADYWSFDEWTSPFSRTPENLLHHYGFFSRKCHFWGDHVMPMANANWFIPDCPDNNLFKFDDDIQREGIRQASQLWDALGIGPMEILASYTYGHRTAKIARESGVKILDSFVQWQNWRDGADDNFWLINQVGAPTVPYYIADDDFRKVAPGRSMLAFTQATTSNVRLNYINTLEGQPQLSLMRLHSREMGETSNIDRFETAVDLLLTEAMQQTEPLFVSVGLENYDDLPDWNTANKIGVRYLHEQAQTQKLVFVSAVDIAGYFERHYPVQPENWIVWPDIYAGLSAGYKPRQLPDRIEISNGQFHTVHQDRQPLPKFFWDYTRSWNEPVWNDQKEIRMKYGLVDPELTTPQNCIPKMVNLDQVSAGVQLRPHKSGAEAVVVINTPRVLACLPVALWQIPLACDGLTAVTGSPDARFIPMVDGSTGNTHGVVVFNNVPQGQSTRTIQLKGRPHQTVAPEVQIGDHIRGRVFFRQATPRVYLWLAEQRTPAGVLHIRVPAGRTASVHYNDGSTEESTGGELSVIFNGTWQHSSPLVTGLTASELQNFATYTVGL